MIHIAQEKCIGCGLCVNDCIAGNIILKDGSVISKGPCILCGHCVAICPSAAVSLSEYDMADVEVHEENTLGLEAQTLLHAIKFRRSIRQYEKQPIERIKLENIVQACMLVGTPRVHYRRTAPRKAADVRWL